MRIRSERPSLLTRLDGRSADGRQVGIKLATRLGLGVALVAGTLAFGSLTSTAAGTLRCQGKVVTIRGDGGANRIHGTSGPDVIHALGGNDTVYGNGGNDTICLGGGNDKANGGNGRDRISGGKGNDLINGGRGFDRISGEAGSDLIDGGRDGALAYGGKGHDACFRSSGPGIGDDPPPGCEKDQLWWGSVGREFSDMVPVSLSGKGRLDHVTEFVPRVNGHLYRRGIGCTNFGPAIGGANKGDFCSFKYKLGRKYTRFATVVGQVDKYYYGYWRVRFDVIGDGKRLESKIIGTNQAKRLVADVSGVSRLTIRIVNLDTRPFDEGMMAVFTEPRVSRHRGLYHAPPL